MRKKQSEEDYEYEQQCFGNPYHIQNFNNFAFIDPKYFSKELNRKVHNDNWLIVVDTEKFMNSLNNQEQQDYEQFIQEFVNMWLPNEPIENYSLCLCNCSGICADAESSLL
jgi:hypothetical protein